ncbi:MAG: enoyl-CoA hydratase [Actinomycetia bacterium]|nr:enoyl-CoA hydratase [Actinomycetes bacterium]
MDLKATRYDVTERLATITLNRPHRMNAWTGRMHTEYRHLLAAAEADSGVRAIIVSGEGRGFCVGGDAEALGGHVEKGGYDPGTPTVLENPGFGVRNEYDHDFAYHFGLTKPVIAALNGPAAGVGLALACFADLRFAAPGIKMTTAHGKLNLPPEFALSWLLPRLVGLGRANDLLFTSRPFTSEEALAMGLVNEVVAADQLMDRVRDYASALVASVSRGSLAASKARVYADLHDDVGTAVRESRRLLEQMMREPDFAEGVAALREKRPPRFS